MNNELEIELSARPGNLRMLWVGLRSQNSAGFLGLSLTKNVLKEIKSTNTLFKLSDVSFAKDGKDARV